MTDTKDKVIVGLSATDKSILVTAQTLIRCGVPKADPEFANKILDLLDRLIDRLTTPPAPQAGEIERAKLAFFNTWPAFANWVRSLEDGYGNKLDVDDIPSEPFEAALRSAQAPTRTYADGIEDAAKAAKYVVENCGTMRFVQANGWVGLRDRVDTSIRALANKAP